jgi:hypothetical protein
MDSRLLLVSTGGYFFRFQYYNDTLGLTGLSLSVGTRLREKNGGSGALLRYSRLEAAPTRYKPYSCNEVSLWC